MTEQIPAPVTIEVDAQTTISIVFGREWPRYVASWSARVQQGESDYPLAGGSVDSMPPKAGEADDVWQALRERAEVAAQAAVAMKRPSETNQKRGLLSRLLGRQ